MNKLQTGFTIVELITVIILIGILAVAVLPKFDGTASYEAHTHRAQLISALRLTQQRAMQQTDGSFCNHLVIESTKYGVPDRVDCTNVDIPESGWQPDATGFIVESRYEVTFSPKVVVFTSMGRPLGCAEPCTIEVSSSVETLKIKIEPEGYIHAQ